MPHLPSPAPAGYRKEVRKRNPEVQKVKGEGQRLGLHYANLINSILLTAGPRRKRLLFKLHFGRKCPFSHSRL